MATIERKTKRYPTDLTDEEWERIAPLQPKPGNHGREPGVNLREVLDAIRYMTRKGGWRIMPQDFQPWQTVYCRFRRFARLMLFRTVQNIALMLDRERVGREASLSVDILDSQTVKAPAPGAERGYDAARKTVGRKRPIAVYTEGRLLMVDLTRADISGSAGAQMILDAIRKRWPWIQHLFADGTYDAASGWTRPPSSTSSSRACAASTRIPASRCYQGAASSNEASAASRAGAGSCATTSSAYTPPKP